MPYAVLVDSMFCSFDTRWYYISIFIRCLHWKTYTISLLKPVSFPQVWGRLSKLYLSVYHPFPFRNKRIITQATRNDTEAGLHWSFSGHQSLRGTVSAEESCLISQGHARSRVACIQWCGDKRPGPLASVQHSSAGSSSAWLAGTFLWDSTETPLLPLLSSASSLPVHRYWSWEHAPVNFVKANLHLMVCFLRNATWANCLS